MPYGGNGYTFERVPNWAELPSGESFVDVCTVRVDERDHVWVLSRAEHPIMEFGPNGERLAAWGAEYATGRPHGMCLAADGTIWWTDDDAHVIRQFDRDGSLRQTIESAASPTDTGYFPSDAYWESVAAIERAAGPFNRPTGVAVGADGDVFISDGYGNARVHVFDADGDHLDSWGTPGAGPGQFRIPHAIVRDGRTLWVADRENSRLQAFDEDGAVLDEWIDVIRPTDVCFDDDTVVVSELARRVSILDDTGRVITRIANDPARDPVFVAPHTVAVDSEDDLYVGEVAVTHAGVDRGANTLQKFRRVV